MLLKQHCKVLHIIIILHTKMHFTHLCKLKWGEKETIVKHNYALRKYPRKLECACF